MTHLAQLNGANLSGNAVNYTRIYPNYPVEVIASYQAAGLWGTASILATVADSAAEFASNTAVVDAATGRTLSYANLLHRVNQVANSLHQAGVQPRDVVVLHQRNSSEYIELCLALYALRAVPVFALPAHGAHDLKALIRSSGARTIITLLPADDFTASTNSTPALQVLNGDDLCRSQPASSKDWVAHGIAAPADELAFFQLSGGTTASPKLIPRHHREYIYSFVESASICQFDASTRFLAVLPLAHNFTMSSPGFLGTLARGGCVVTQADPSTAAVAKTITNHEVTVIAGVPALVQQWLNDDGDHAKAFASVKTLQVGGARFAPALAARVQDELGCDLQQVYGMAEGLVCFTRTDYPEALITQSQGRPISQADEVRIISLDGTERDANRECHVGESGEILVRGPYTIRGYFNAPEINASSFTPEGFYRTGDVGFRDAAGNITVTGRVKDQINRGGEKFAPAELEDLLLQHPQIHDVSVVAAQRGNHDEEPHAYIVPRANTGETLHAKQVRKFLRDQGVAAFKIPSLISIVSSLPYTAVGKVHRRSLRDEPADQTILDVIGIGFGPTNIAVACAIAESDTPVKHLFLEAREVTTWHPDLMFPQASMQISFVKDLVTLRNPSSKFSFIAFLHAENRLLSFLNRGKMAPLRTEFAQYLAWVVRQLPVNLGYQSRVTHIVPVTDTSGKTTAFTVHCSDGSEHTARSIVLGTGLQAQLPALLGEARERVFHSGEFLSRMHDLEGKQITRAVVLGGGQSAAECIEYLYANHPDTEIHAVISRYGLVPSDSSPYVNEVFDPELIDDFYRAPESARTQLVNAHAATNYSVANESTVGNLYEAEYQDKVRGRTRLHWHRMSHLVAAQNQGNQVRLNVRSDLTGEKQVLDADLVVCATGYRPLELEKLLTNSSEIFDLDALGRVQLQRDYSARLLNADGAQFFMPGHSQASHGLTATLLSNVAVRAGEILASVVAPSPHLQEVTS